MKKNKMILVIFSLILTIFSISNILFINNGYKDINLEININKKDEDKDIIINKFLINENNYMVKNLFDVEEDKISYNFDKKFIYKVSKNDIINIEFNSKNIKNINVTLDNKKLDTIKKDNKIYINNNINIVNILKEQFSNTNLFLMLLLGVTFTLLYYFIFKYITLNITKIFDNKIKIIDIVVTMIMLFIIYYLNYYAMITILNILFPLVIFGILSLIIYLNKTKLNLVNVFLVMTMFLGMTIMFLIPPFHILDEDNHYVKTYDHLFFFEKSHAEKNYTTLSNNVYEFRDKYQNIKFQQKKINTLDYYNDLTTKVEYKDLNDKGVGFGTYSAMKLAYIPSNFLTFICKILNCNILFTFLVARFVNLLLATILCYLAIKIIPICKPLLFVIMTFGICTQSIMGVNQDWLNTSSCFLSIAYILSLVYSKKKLEIKNFVILGILAICLAFSKTVYTPIFLLVLLIDNKKLGKYPIIKKLGIIGVAFSLTLLSYFWNTIFCPEILIDKASTVEYHTVSGFIKNPKSFFTIYYNSFTSRFLEDSLKGYFDGYGWYTIWHNKLIKLFILCSYFLIIFTLPKEKMKEEKKSKIIMLLIYIIMYGLITASMLFTWSNIKLNYIDGLQPRYFIPIIFCLYYIFNNNIFKIKNNIKYQSLLILCILFINFLSYFTIVYRLF